MKVPEYQVVDSEFFTDDGAIAEGILDPLRFECGSHPACPTVVASVGTTKSKLEGQCLVVSWKPVDKVAWGGTITFQLSPPCDRLSTGTQANQLAPPAEAGSTGAVSTEGLPSSTKTKKKLEQSGPVTESDPKSPGRPAEEVEKKKDPPAPVEEDEKKKEPPPPVEENKKKEEEPPPSEKDEKEGKPPPEPDEVEEG